MIPRIWRAAALGRANSHTAEALRRFDVTFQTTDNYNKDKLIYIVDK